MPRRATAARGLGLCVAAAAGVVTAAPAAATEGSLYSFGIEALVAQSAADGQCSVAQAGASFGVTCPPAATSLTGTKWQIDLRTPVAGSVIEALGWRVVRFHQTATSVAQQALADGALAWELPESDIPRSPSPPKAYRVGMRAQTASLRLFQTEARRQPNRVWTFLDPAIWVRDTEPPSARWTSVPSGWISDDTAWVAWQASDNFGSDGIGRQRVAAAGRSLYAAAPGQGAHAAALDLASLPDGVHPLRLEADGDGTAAAAPQDATLRIDRTPPSAAVRVLGLPNDGLRVTVDVSDATSGVQDWTLHARSADGPPVASSSTGEGTSDIDLAAYAAPAETIRFVLEAKDNAGLAREVTSAQVTRPAPPPPGPPPATVGGGVAAAGTPKPLARSNARRLRPRAGLVVRTRRPVLRWRKGPRGTKLYNLQVFRVTRGQGGRPTTVRKVLSAFPRARAFRLPPRRLRPRTCYVWRVWPYRGKRYTRAPLGVSNFCVADKKVLAAAARAAAARRRAAAARGRSVPR